MSKILIEARDIALRHGEQTVLNIGAIAIFDGERIGLIGENGAGKSTLLNVLSGAITADTGTVRRYCPVAVIRQQGAT